MSMKTLQIGPEDIELLTQVLDWYLSEIRMEIANTDRIDARAILKQKKRLIEGLVAQLGDGSVSASDPSLAS